MDQESILWRISMPLATDIDLIMGDETFIEWMGSLRWIKSKENPLLIRAKVSEVGGHATIYHATNHVKKKYGSFTQLGGANKRVQLTLKKVFDPEGLFNKGRLYPFMYFSLCGY